MSLCAKFHTFVPICAMVQLTALTNIPNGLQVILKTISVISEYIITIRLSSKVFMNT